MNGLHALRPHNRKYYYNVFEQLFEPIYYDGDLIKLKTIKIIPAHEELTVNYELHQWCNVKK